jgi:hypothetical protein
MQHAVLALAARVPFDDLRSAAAQGITDEAVMTLPYQ